MIARLYCFEIGKDVLEQSLGLVDCSPRDGKTLPGLKACSYRPSSDTVTTMLPSKAKSHVGLQLVLA